MDGVDASSGQSFEPATVEPRGNETSGWLRPAVFRVMDGLVSNVSLIAGVGGGGGSRDALVLAGLAGLVAGGFSMGTGEYTSVRAQNEAIESQIGAVVTQLVHDPESKQIKLAASYERRGVRRDIAEAVAEDLSADRDEAIRSHACELLGVDPTNPDSRGWRR